MKLPRQKREEISSATITQAMGLILALSSILTITALGTQPTWWATRGATHAPQVVTNSGVISTNYITNDYAGVTQGQMKQFLARAADEMNANLSGGAGTNINGMLSNWASDYATNGYGATNIKPSDFTWMNVGQLKYIGNKVWSQLVAGGYTNAVPTWLAVNTNTDAIAANVGQLKQVFNFALPTNNGSGGGMDTNGLASAWEIQYFGQTGLNANSSPDGNGFTLLQDYQGGANPTNYYSQPSTNGPVTITPVLAITGGNNQISPVGTFANLPLAITVMDSGSHPLTNAPVTFATSGSTGGQLSISMGGAVGNSSTVTADSNGNAQTYYAGSASSGTTNLIQAVAGTSTITFSESTVQNTGAVAAPSGIAQTMGGSNGQVFLNWSNNATNAAYLIIQHSIDGLNWTTITTLTNPATTNYTVNETNYTQSYYYGVIAGKP